MKSVDLSRTGNQFLDDVKAFVASSSTLPPPFRKYDYDCLKIEHHAHGAKSNDPVINTENDETLILSKGKHLSESNVKHETEIAFFKLNDYLQYQSTK